MQICKSHIDHPPPLSSCADWSSLLLIQRPFTSNYSWHSPPSLSINTSSIIHYSLNTMMESDAMDIDTPYRSQFNRSRKVRITSMSPFSYRCTIANHIPFPHYLLCLTSHLSSNHYQSSLRTRLSSGISSVSRIHSQLSPLMGNKSILPRSLNVH